jgi:hypothetical protein
MSVNNELQVTLKEVIMYWLKVLSWYLREGTEEYHKEPQECWCLSRDSNRLPPESMQTLCHLIKFARFYHIEQCFSKFRQLPTTTWAIGAHPNNPAIVNIPLACKEHAIVLSSANVRKIIVKFDKPLDRSTNLKQYLSND